MTPVVVDGLHMTTHTNVLIIGAGPVGLVAACELARRAVPVRIIDKLEAPTTESRAVLVHARSLEALARVGVAEEIVAASRHTTAMEIHADGGTLTRVPLDTVRSPYPFSASLGQDETERILTARLVALGVTIERGRELVSLEQDDEGVRAILRDGETIEARWLIGCDGAHSTVRHLLGMRLEGSFVGERFVLGDVEADHDLDRSAMHTFFSRDSGPLIAFPMAGDRLRLIGEADDHTTASLDALQALVDRFGLAMRLKSSHWLTTFEIHHGQVPRYRVGRAFLAGDAAHIHSPAGGHGMNTGIQDAFNLAWKLAVDNPSEALLDSYHAERYPVAEHVIKFTTATTRAGTIEHPLARRLRNEAMGVAMGLAPIAHKIADEMEETSIGYRRSPIVAGRHFGRGPRPGDVAPALSAPVNGHAVLEVGTTVADPDDAYGFGAYGGIAVVRPDGYIGLLAQTGDTRAVDAYFDLIGRNQ